MRFHTQTAGVSLTAQQPLNNIVRTALEALAGVLGGTQSLHTNSYDEALALPSEQAVRVALRTQQIIAEETGVANTIDPLGGSYFVEALTDRMEELCYEYFQKIDELGGMVEAVKQGFPQREIADAAYAHQRELDAGERILVGVNGYTEGAAGELEILRIDPALEQKQIARVQAVRARRDNAAVEHALTALKQAAYDYFAKIDELGGMVEAVKRGFPQREIADAAFVLQQEIERNDRIVVGVNDYRDLDERPIEILHIDPALERKQVERVKAVRARRDSEGVEREFARLREAAAGEANLMPLLLDCARAHATEGEMVEALQQVWGSYTEAPVF